MRRALRVTAAGLLVLVVGTGGYAWYLYHSVQQTLSAIYEPIQPAAAAEIPLNQGGKDASVQTLAHVSSTDTDSVTLNLSGGLQHTKPISLNDKDPFTMLFLGVDERTKDVGRSDAIIVLSVNPAKHSVLMFNIPRDTRTEIVGKGKVDKINHAYAFGGVNMSIRTIENYLNIPIDYYVKVNMEGFANIIDILGGVEVDNPFAFDFEGVTYPQGKVSLDGHNALMYSRMRYDDPQGDIGRNARQQSILTELITRAKRVSTVAKLPDILEQIRQNVKTNLTVDDMKTIYNNYRTDIDDVDKDEVIGAGEIIDGIYYYKVSEAERTRIHNKLVAQLE